MRVGRRKLASPLGKKKNKGNAPWLKVRRKARVAFFR